jgi:hypothetical protein
LEVKKKSLYGLEVVFFYLEVAMSIVLETLFVSYIIWKLELLERDLRRIREWIDENFPDEID